MKTISPSMDILISSNLERLLYDLADGDAEYIKSLMKELNETGKYKVNDEILGKIKTNFIAGYATDEETSTIISKVWNEEKYLLDPHTAVAYKVMLEQKDLEGEIIVLSTASPYKFCASVAKAVLNENNEDEFKLMEKLHSYTQVEIPKNLSNLKEKTILHSDVIKKEEMGQYVLEASK